MGATKKTLSQRQNYFNNPNLCLYCHKPLLPKQGQKLKEAKRKKFCNQSCSGSFYGIDRPKKDYFCESCGDKISTGYVNKKFCDYCRYNNNPNFKNWSAITLNDFKIGRTNTNVHARIRSLARTEYQKSGLPLHCCNCDYKNHFEICHRVPFAKFPGTALISEINRIDNLVALCPNCHWDFDHGYLVI